MTAAESQSQPVDHEAMMRNIETTYNNVNMLLNVCCVVMASDGLSVRLRPPRPAPASANNPDLSIKLGQGQPRPGCV